MANVSIWHAVYLLRKDYFLILHVRVTSVAVLPVTQTFIIKKWFKIIKGRYALNDDFSLSNARLFTPLCYVHSFALSSSFLLISTFAIYKILQKIPQAPFLQPLRGPTGILPSCAWTAHFHRSFSDAHVRATMSAVAAMCHTHSHLQRHSGNDGVLRHPRLPKQNNFSPEKLLCFINLPTLILSQTMLLHCPQQNKTEVVFRLPPLRPPPSFIIVWV